MSAGIIFNEPQIHAERRRSETTEDGVLEPNSSSRIGVLLR
ncbi:hypothetical protein FTUN_2085 [Frigoriglobus tundricola]|uniref:Uncharacterized protein n=1 Tax=Frigoriglobus tundricola TaxID=2774151 RepID=A0A6M5YLV1_9BACT|nr:hypothetical protein FTUN_2085 [Frigoriglobus tundricola]